MPELIPLPMVLAMFGFCLSERLYGKDIGMSLLFTMGGSMLGAISQFFA